MTIDERVDRLERRNRQLLVAIVGMLSVGVLAVFVAGRMATAEAGVETVEEVRKKKLVIMNDGGRVRATLAVQRASGWAGLQLYDTNGETRIGLGVSKGAPGLILGDADNKPRIDLGVFADGPALLLYDAKRELRTELFVDEDGPGLNMHDARGRELWGAP